MLVDDGLLLPKGYGFRRMPLVELRERTNLFDTLLIWEGPRRHGPRRYVIAVDVSDGLGQDRSVIEVARMGTIEEPAEQVAQYVSDQIAPMALAYVIQAIGQYYVDEDGVEALVAIECNNHGLSTQDTLQLHLGYQHWYRWEFYDAADPAARFSNKIGWLTTTRTRPLLLDKFKSALTTIDPITGLPDYVTHSPLLHDELRDFQTQGALWEAEAARGAHDDCVMASAIANYVCWRLQAGETEPVEERRRRRSEESARIAAAADASTRTPPDWRNTPCTAEEMQALAGQDGEVEDLDHQLADPRGIDVSVFDSW